MPPYKAWGLFVSTADLARVTLLLDNDGRMREGDLPGLLVAIVLVGW